MWDRCLVSSIQTYSLFNPWHFPPCKLMRVLNFHESSALTLPITHLTFHAPFQTNSSWFLLRGHLSHLSSNIHVFLRSCSKLDFNGTAGKQISSFHFNLKPMYRVSQKAEHLIFVTLILKNIAYFYFIR